MSKPLITKSLSTIIRKYFESDYQYDFKQTLAKLGWNECGSGAYSTVFLNKTKPYVLKVTDTPDQNYAQYVSLIKKFRNKHFPKISNQKEFKIRKRKYYVYLIEKLYKIPNNKKIFLAQNIEDLCELDANDLKRMLKGDFSNFDTIIDPTVIRFAKKHPSIVKAASLIANSYLSIDIHDENIMQRIDGTIVIIDPYC